MFSFNPYASSIFQQTPSNNSQSNIQQTSPSTSSKMTGVTSTTATTELHAYSIDDLTNAFAKMNLADGSFSEIFLYMFKTQPNTIINFIPTHHTESIEGTTTFNIKYEEDFLKQVQQYNSLPYGKYIIGYRKENTSNVYSFYNCTYTIKFTTKNPRTMK